MFDWKRRLLELGLAGGLTAAGTSCGPSMMNSCGAPAPTPPANFLDTHPVTTPLLGCPALPTSPPAPFGNPPAAKHSWCADGSSAGAIVAVDDRTLGYSPQDVLDAANAGATGSMTWWDGTTTKVHFHLDVTPKTEFSVVDNAPNAGFCSRTMGILGLVATLTSDDGRLAESTSASIGVVDYGGRFKLEDVTVSLNQPFIVGNNQQPDATKGTLAVDVRKAFPSGTLNAGFSVTLLLKGIGCVPGCPPGTSPNGMDPLTSGCSASSGLIMASERLASGGCVASVYVGRWEWD
jgi:hypothetical protein